MILYYTGTGNSAFAAKRIGAALEDEVLNLFERLRGGDCSPLKSEKPWVVVCPTYAWQLPHIVRDHLLNTELQGSRELYFVLTCGSGIGNAGGYARELCQQKGMIYRGCTAVVMPENYLAMFKVPGEEKSREIVRKALPVMDEAAKHILRGEPFPEKITAADRLISGVVNRSFYALSIKDSKFTVSEKCSSCGLCTKVCPMNNVRLEDGKPRWQSNCTHCMACITRCPAEAIEYGRKSVGQPRYRCPKEEEL